MHLNDILQRYSIEEISQTTRIPARNLESLLHGEWSHLKKVQALGFISILEREYHLDLSDMKRECKSYFEHNSSNDDLGKFTLLPDDIESEPKRKFGKFILIIILLGLAFGSWYLFVDKNKSFKSDNNMSKNGKSESFYNSVFDEANKWIGGFGSSKKDKNSTNRVNEISKKSKAVEKKSKSILPKKNEKKEELTTAPKAVSDKNITQKDEDEKIIEQVKAEEEAKERAKSSETNASDTNKEEEVVLADSKSNKESADNNSEISSLISIATGISDEDIKVHKNIESKATVSKKDNTPKETNSNKNAIRAKTVIFHPRSKVWVGYTELRSMKRYAKVTKDDIPFDTAKGDYILATGHGIVEFSNPKGKILLKLNDGKKHYFMIAKGGVREISHEAFQKLNKNKVW